MPRQRRSHLLAVLVHLAQRQEVFDEEHDVDAAERRQPLPHAVQVLLLVAVETRSRPLRPRDLMVVVVVVEVVGGLGLEKVEAR